MPTTIDGHATEKSPFALATWPGVTHLVVAFQASSPKLSNGWLSGWPFFCAFEMRRAALPKA
jgi:hypothetical protein